MANAQRRKGLRGEAEVAAIWRSHGFDVRGLEGEGDHTVTGLFGGERLHSEVKRQNRLRTEWIAQAEREAPAGAVPVVAWRPDGGKWWAMIPLEDLARLLA
jgi:hypothetical protein